MLSQEQQTLPEVTNSPGELNSTYGNSSPEVDLDSESGELDYDPRQA